MFQTIVELLPSEWIAQIAQVDPRQIHPSTEFKLFYDVAV